MKRIGDEHPTLGEIITRGYPAGRPEASPLSWFGHSTLLLEPRPRPRKLLSLAPTCKDGSSPLHSRGGRGSSTSCPSSSHRSGFHKHSRLTQHERGLLWPRFSPPKYRLQNTLMPPWSNRRRSLPASVPTRDWKHESQTMGGLAGGTFPTPSYPHMAYRKFWQAVENRSRPSHNALLDASPSSLNSLHRTRGPSP